MVNNDIASLKQCLHNVVFAAISRGKHEWCATAVVDHVEIDVLTFYEEFDKRLGGGDRRVAISAIVRYREVYRGIAMAGYVGVCAVA